MASAGRPTKRRGLFRDKPHRPFTHEAKRVLEGSLREALDRGDKHIGDEHILLAVLSRTRVAAEVLAARGVTAVADPSCCDVCWVVLSNGRRPGVNFEQFVAAQLPALVRYATMLAQDRELAQDVVQDTLIRAHSRWRRIDAMDRPEHYVKRMVTSEYLSWRRRRARRAAVMTRWGAGLAPSTVTDHAEGTVQRSALNQQLAELPGKHRAVLVLDFYEGLDDTEIAELLGCSPGTVRVYRSRALAALRSVLAEPVSTKEGT